MKIAPKINENISSFTPAIREICTDGVLEIQLLSRDPDRWLCSVRDYLDTGLLRHLIIHLPIPSCQIGHIYLSDELRSSFERLCSGCGKLRRKYGVSLSILFHCDSDYRYLQFSGCVTWLKNIIDENQELLFLVENIFPDSNCFVGESRFLTAPFLSLLEDIDEQRLGFCFDLCHYEVGNTIFHDRYVLPERLFAKYTRYVHFNHVADHDGYMTHETHSRRHPDLERCRTDLQKLLALGIPLDDCVLTLEISEEDYSSRPDLLTEYALVSQALKRF